MKQRYCKIEELDRFALTNGWLETYASSTYRAWVTGIGRIVTAQRVINCGNVEGWKVA